MSWGFRFISVIGFTVFWFRYRAAGARIQGLESVAFRAQSPVACFLPRQKKQAPYVGFRNKMPRVEGKVMNLVTMMQAIERFRKKGAHGGGVAAQAKIDRKTKS